MSAKFNNRMQYPQRSLGQFINDIFIIPKIMTELTFYYPNKLLKVHRNFESYTHVSALIEKYTTGNLLILFSNHRIKNFTFFAFNIETWF